MNPFQSDVALQVLNIHLYTLIAQPQLEQTDDHWMPLVVWFRFYYYFHRFNAQGSIFSQKLLL